MSREGELYDKTGGVAAGMDFDICPMDDDFWSGSVSPVLPFMMKDLAQNTEAQVLVPTVLAGSAVIIAILSPFVGVLVKRVARKSTLIATRSRNRRRSGLTTSITSSRAG